MTATSFALFADGKSQAVLAILAVVAIYAGIYGYEFYQTSRLEKFGKVARAWIVQANDALYSLGTDDRPGLFLISFPEENGVRDVDCASLAKQMFALRTLQNPTPLQKRIAAIALNETYQAEAQGLLPREATHGKDVFWFQMMVSRDFLPGGVLKHPYIQVKAMRRGNVVMAEMIDYLPATSPTTKINA